MKKPPGFFSNFSRRHSFAEKMDDFNSDPYLLDRTFSHLELINSIFGRGLTLFKEYFLPVMKTEPSRVWTLLDAGAGGGDMAEAFAVCARRYGLKLKVTAADFDKRSENFFRQKRGHLTDVIFKRTDLLKLKTKFDFVYAGHFLHHFSDSDAKQMVHKLQSLSRKKMIINDLHRSRPWYVLYTLFAGIFLHKSFAYFDGRLSIIRGFKIRELKSLSTSIKNTDIHYLLPGRIIFVSNKDS